MNTPPLSQAELEAAARAYLAKVGRRYVPAAIGLAILAAVVTLVPTVPPPGAYGVPSLAASGPASRANSGTGGSTASTAGGPASAGASSDAGSAVGTSGPGGSPGGQITSGTAAPAGCAGGSRQFSWSAYAPPCAPASQAGNGGTTAHGVTATTITLTFREPNSTEQAGVNAFAGTANINVAAFIADMNTYINFFNSQFQLNGRKVVLKPYQGQGDYLQETGGQGLAGAQADAVTAHDLGGFADVTFPLFTSTYYLQDLAQEHVIGTGGLGLPDSWFEQYAPYEYSYVPTGTAGANGFAHAVCTRMWHLPAAFAGDAALRTKTRVLGLITPDNPNYIEVGHELESTLQTVCGASVARYATYSEGNVSQYETQADSMMAQMRAHGVTTVICGCDPLFPILVSQAASQQAYSPEWISTGWGDPITRDYAQSEWSHALSNEAAYLPQAQTEAYHAFQLASPRMQPREQYFEVAYYMLLTVFDGLQNAGAGLTPVTFAQGMFAMPKTPLGQDGVWSGGRNAFSLANVTTQIGWWDPNATSNFDGEKGAWQNCDGGRWFVIKDNGGWGPQGTQFHCFGR